MFFPVISAQDVDPPQRDHHAPVKVFDELVCNKILRELRIPLLNTIRYGDDRGEPFFCDGIRKPENERELLIESPILLGEHHAGPEDDLLSEVLLYLPPSAAEDAAEIVGIFQFREAVILLSGIGVPGTFFHKFQEFSVHFCRKDQGIYLHFIVDREHYTVSHGPKLSL